MFPVEPHPYSQILFRIHNVFCSLIEEEDMEKRTIRHMMRYRLWKKIETNINRVPLVVLEIIREEVVV